MQIMMSLSYHACNAEKKKKKNLNKENIANIRHAVSFFKIKHTIAKV